MTAACWWDHFTWTHTVQTHMPNPNTGTQTATRRNAQPINHGAKMKDTCAGARRADILYICRQLVCGPLKATVSAHHLAEVNGPTPAEDLLISFMPWVTVCDTHTHTPTLSIIPSLPICLSLSHTHTYTQTHRLQRIPGGEDIHSDATPTTDISYKWQQWQFWHSLNSTHLANVYEYEQTDTKEVGSVYKNMLLLLHYEQGSTNWPN